MTIDEFMKQLARVRGKWQWPKGGPLRLCRGKHDWFYCPISAVIRLKTGSKTLEHFCAPISSGITYLSLSQEDAKKIQETADRDNDPVVSHQLMKACRLI